jgi:hypothetical protein
LRYYQSQELSLTEPDGQLQSGIAQVPDVQERIALVLGIFVTREILPDRLRAVPLGVWMLDHCGRRPTLLLAQAGFTLESG